MTATLAPTFRGIFRRGLFFFCRQPRANKYSQPREDSIWPSSRLNRENIKRRRKNTSARDGRNKLRNIYRNEILCLLMTFHGEKNFRFFVLIVPALLVLLFYLKKYYDWEKMIKGGEAVAFIVFFLFISNKKQRFHVMNIFFFFI